MKNVYKLHIFMSLTKYSNNILAKYSNNILAKYSMQSVMKNAPALTWFHCHVLSFVPPHGPTSSHPLRVYIGLNHGFNILFSGETSKVLPIRDLVGMLNIVRWWSGSHEVKPTKPHPFRFKILYYITNLNYHQT